MKLKRFLVICIILTQYSSSYACSMEGVTNWLLPVTQSIYDTERNTFFRRTTTNIAGINTVTYSDGLNAGPYVNVSYNESSEFTIATNDQFQNYEEYETIDSMGVTVVFRCTGGTIRTLVFSINIIDTNNNAPQFRPNDNYHFKIAPPVLPGFLITDCVNDIIARDIDLTTQKIDFQMEDNSYFEISYDTSTMAKEFKATLRTTTFIRSLPEPIILWISATDVDHTGDPPLTTTATVRIEADSEFKFPEDLIFSETFYLAAYTDDHQVVVENDIYLQQGYDENVNFSLQGDIEENFDLIINENDITLKTKSQLSPEILRRTQLFLIIKASREYTSDTTATIILNLPEAAILKFEKTYYEGLIVNNSLKISNLVLQDGFEDADIVVNIHSEFARFFTAIVQKNIITLNMDPLDDDVIKENNILTLQLVATTNDNIANTIVLLEIIKEDYVTPVFEKSIYNATYDPLLGVIVERIVLIQGYDDEVVVSLAGEYESYFHITSDGNVFNINSSDLPSYVINEQHLLLTVIASKPRTVGARAVIYIAMPEARPLAFQFPTYRGYLENTSVTLETIELSIGYGEDVTFTLSGEFASYFWLINNGNEVILKVFDQLPENIISDNNHVIIHLTAVGNNTDTARTTIVIEILKHDENTPVFSQNIYSSSYVDAFLINIEKIFLIQGFDENVTFHLSGDHAQFFGISYMENNISIYLQSAIPEEFIYNNKFLLFNILAKKTLTVGANAVIYVNFPRELIEPTPMRFSKNSYTGQIENEVLTIETITLSEGFRAQSVFSLTGEYANYFAITHDENNVTLKLIEKLPADVIDNNLFIILNVEAFHPYAIWGHATIILELMREEQPNLITPIFEHPFYFGEYSVEYKLQFPHIIQLKEGFDENTIFKLEEENSVWFTLIPVTNGITLTLRSPIPAEILENNQQLIFVITAEKLNTTISAKATIVIAVRDENNSTLTLAFEKTSYIGAIDNDTLNMQTISLVEGFSSDVLFTLHGELASYFSKTTNEATIVIKLENAIPQDVLPNNRIIVLELEASAPRAISSYATIVLEVVRHEELPANVEVLKFSESYYVGLYNVTEGLVFDHIITLAKGYDESVQFALVGDNSEWFGLVPSFGGVKIAITIPIPSSVLANNRQLIFEVNANKESSPVVARSAIIIILGDEIYSTHILGFEKTNYVGSLDNISVNVEEIILVEGYTTDVQFSLYGDLASLFSIKVDGARVSLLLQNIITEEILSQNPIIILELKASLPEALSSHTIIVLKVEQQIEQPAILDLLKFKEPYYIGVYTEIDGLNFDNIITLAENYDERVIFTLEGDNSIWFSLKPEQDGLILILNAPIPIEIVSQNWQLIFIIKANRSESIPATSTIIISLQNGTEEAVGSFDKLLYSGVLQGSAILHENIFVSGYDGISVDILGNHANLFVAQINEGIVTVELRNSTTLPVLTSYVILELHIPGAAGILVLDVINPENPILPTIIFSSESYVIRVESTQIGLAGQVSATADNGEAVTYSLLIENDELKEQLLINNNGELYLSAPARNGLHTLEVIATSVYTRVNGSATVLLIVEASTCENVVGIPPLIVIDRDEETPHGNLVVLNTTIFKDCQYVMTSQWPIDQTWLYVDENVLHARAIDREHESIAFMTVSQIQVELTLKCENNEPTNRLKRSLIDDSKPKSLRSYDYGSNKWILTDTISFNARRSFVNLIVNDINDNDPIFILKETEPIAVGYPLPELEEIVMPRALAELKATDADIEENAALVYWSSEPVLAVSPSTGYVHVRNNADLQNGDRLAIHATDRNGLGRTGSVELVVLVRLLNVNQIAVITIRDAFLEDEQSILANLSSSLGYEVKTLRTIVIPIDSDEEKESRKKRSTVASTGAVLQFYIYGLIEREPVEVSQLIVDINNNVIMGNVARMVSLEDHLENREICPTPERDMGLLAATIALSVLFFIIIVVFALWIFLKCRKRNNYDKFSDQNSLASRDQFEQASAKPRLNLEDLKRSEKRLQEMLDAPVEQLDASQDKQPEPKSPEEDASDTIVNVSSSPELRMPIVIQSIDKLKDAVSDDDDEFGETRKARRKSVVTFNENVEKIIHLEDNPNDSEYEVYRF